MDFTALFVDVDDFWQRFRPEYERRLLDDGGRRRRRAGKLSVSEIMTLLIAFQRSNYRTFKHFYGHVQRHHRDAFPDLVHYGRFVKLIERVTLPLFAYLRSRCVGQVSGISFIDSTPLRVCSTKRVSRHRVFEGVAALGKSTVGWFFGFKLHLVINDRGELLAFAITPGNVDDRQPVPTLAKSLWGRLFGDKGYLGRALFEELYAGGVKLITQIRKNEEQADGARREAAASQALTDRDGQRSAEERLPDRALPPPQARPLPRPPPRRPRRLRQPAEEALAEPQPR